MLVRSLPLLLVPVAVVVVAGCGGGGGGEEHIWSGPPAPSSQGQIVVTGWNEHVEETGEPAARSPVASADTFLRLDRRDASSVSVVVRRGPEAGDEAAVTVLLDGLLDDSVRAERYILELTRGDGGTWVFLSASWAQRCQPGRGHQEFSPVPCV